MITIRMSGTAARPVLADGSTANPLWPFIIEAQSWGVRPLRSSSDGYVYLDGVKNTNLFDLDTLKLIMSSSEQLYGANSVEVLNYPAWVEVDDETAEVPAYAPWPDIVVDEETTRRPRYDELRLAREVDGKWYAPASDGQNYFDGSVLMLLDNTSGVSVVAAPPVVAIEEPSE